MKFKEVILDLLEKHGIKKAQLAKEIGVGRSSLQNQLNRNKDWWLSTMIKWLEKLGYKIVVMPIYTPLPKDSYELK